MHSCSCTTYNHITFTKPTDVLKFYVINKIHKSLYLQEMLFRGRIRVQIKNDDGIPLKPEYSTRESVMKFIGEAIPKLKTRQNRYV